MHRSGAALALARGERAACTAIYYLLAPDGFSALHRVRSDEVWTLLDGDALELTVLHPDGRLERRVLGRDLARGEEPLLVVPADAWQGARPFGPRHALCACTVAPGFDFADFELAARDALAAEFPGHADAIARLTRAS